MTHILHLLILASFQVGQVEWGTKDQVNIWEHVNLWPLFLEESFAADGHHRFCAGLA